MCTAAFGEEIKNMRSCCWNDRSCLLFI